MSEISELIIYTDGGSRGNPGPAAIGVYVVSNDGKFVDELKETLGVGTNNEAEYQGFLRSLAWLKGFINEKHLNKVTWRLDSKLVVEQINKNWKIKEPRLQKYALSAWEGLQNLPFEWQIEYVPRAQNKEADSLVNEALDNLLD